MKIISAERLKDDFCLDCSSFETDRCKENECLIHKMIDEAPPAEIGLDFQFPEVDKELLLAFNLLKKRYDKAKKSDLIQKPLAWSLYQVWKEIDLKESGPMPDSLTFWKK